MTIGITKREGNWTFGTIDGYDFEVKHYDEPSEFGIEQEDEPGRISKLWIGRRSCRSCIACYDRGWDKLPCTAAELEITQAVIDLFN